MATVTGYQAGHLQNFLRAQQEITEEITFGTTIDDSEDIIHTINVPDTILVPIFVTVRAEITLENTVDYDRFKVGAFVDGTEVGSVINSHAAGIGLPKSYVISTTIPVAVEPETAAVVTLRGVRVSGSGTASRNTTAKSVLTAVIEPDWSEF